MPYRHIFMFCLFKSCKSSASIFYKQLPYFQILFQEFFIFHCLTIAVFKHTGVNFVNWMCFVASAAAQHLPSFPAILNWVLELNTSSGTDDKSRKIQQLKCHHPGLTSWRKQTTFAVFLNKGKFSDIILSLLLPDYVDFLKTVPYISVTKKRPSLGPSLLNCKPVNILFCFCKERNEFKD